MLLLAGGRFIVFTRRSDPPKLPLPVRAPKAPRKTKSPFVLGRLRANSWCVNQPEKGGLRMACGLTLHPIRLLCFTRFEVNESVVALTS